MANDQAQIDAAKLNIEYCHIVSPVGGRVGLRLVDPGNYVQPTDTTRSRRHHPARSDQRDLLDAGGQSAAHHAPAESRRQAARSPSTTAPTSRRLGDGELTTYDNEIDTTTGTFKLRAMFANQDNALFPSQFVNVRLLVDTLKDVVVVPNAAVQLGAAGPFVYVVKDDSTVAVRKVTPGPSDATRTVIESGAAGGRQSRDRRRRPPARRRQGARRRGRVAIDAAAPGAGRAGGAGGGGGQHRRHRDGATRPGQRRQPRRARAP